MLCPVNALFGMLISYVRKMHYIMPIVLGSQVDRPGQ
jgi:hypothetical protein